MVRLSSAAVTVESTPPDIAATTRDPAGRPTAATAARTAASEREASRVG